MKFETKLKIDFGKAGEFLRRIGAYLKSFFGKLAPKKTFLDDSRYVLDGEIRKTPPALKITLAILSILIFVSLTYFAVMIYAFKSDDKVTNAVAGWIPYPVAVVNTDFVTYYDYHKEVRYIHHFYKATQQAENVDLKQVDRQILEQLIENKIVEQNARKYNVKVTKAEEDEIINALIEKNGGKDKVEKVLNDMYGIGLKQFRRLVRIQLLRDKLNEKAIARIEASHILIKVAEDASEDQVTAAKQKIEGIKVEIAGGLDFGEAAKKYSEDSGSATEGGRLEPFSKGEMVESFSNTSFATSVDQISEPVRTEYGWHIIKVHSRQGTVEESYSEWLSNLRKKSFVLNMLYRSTNPNQLTD